jgi:Na+/H+ antiporter NhaD/arsenite permease-like protein
MMPEANVKDLRGVARTLSATISAGAGTLVPDHALAAGAGGGIDGASLSLLWIIPFAGILASLAILPLVTPHFWHRRNGLVALFWALAFLLPFAARFGDGVAFHELLHVLFHEYLPFIILIGALFTIAGGIYVGGDLHGGPVLNSAILAIGTVLASFAGTTGASMILIRPLIRANDGRRHNVHVVVFFIFLVSNIGGALTPLGDPPLFLGYLQGVSFFWPLQYLWEKTAILAVLLLGTFVLVDSYLYRKEGRVRPDPTPETKPFVRGLVNVPLMLLLVAVVAASGLGAGLGQVSLFGVQVGVAGIVRDCALVALAAASLVFTPRVCREKNEFNWAPVAEVAKLFAAIFITIVPAIAILKAGPSGSFAPLFALLGPPAQPDNAAYFWLTGLLSSFLDNAPTYLVFFHAAGGDAHTLMGPMAQTLAAISAGAVFMGANTYLGNAPNFLVKSIAEHQGVKMPSFFGFMIWPAVFLIPSFVLISLLFF